MTPKDTPHTATQGASESDAFKRWAIENHHAYLTARGLRFVDDDEAALWTGWQGRAALAQRQPADPQAPSQEAREYPPLYDGMVAVPCAVMMDQSHHQNGWLFIPHADDKWVSLMKLDGFSGKVIEYWLAERAAIAKGERHE